MPKMATFGAEIVNDVCRSGDYQHELFRAVGDATNPAGFVVQDGPGYSPVVMDSNNFGNASTDGTIANTAALGYASDGGAWADNVGTGVKRTVGDTIIYFLPLPAPKPVDAGGSLTFDVGDITFAET